MQKLRTLSLILKNGSKATNHPDIHGIPTQIIRNQLFSNFQDKQGIGHPAYLSLADPSSKSIIERCVSSGGVLYLHLQ